MIGEKLRLLRANSGKNQRDVCDALNIEQSTLANYENEKRTPKIEILVKLAEYYNVSLDYLLGRTEDPQRPGVKIRDSQSISETSYLEKVGRNIHDAIERLAPSATGWDIDDMSKIFSIDGDLLNDIFNGFTWPPYDFLEKVSGEAHVSTDYLLCLTQNTRSSAEYDFVPFRFNRTCRERLKAVMDKYDEDSPGMWPFLLGITDTELYLLQEYGFLFHFQILETICQKTGASADYLLGFTDGTNYNSRRGRMADDEEAILRYYARDKQDVMMLLESFCTLHKKDRTILLGKCFELEKEQSAATEMPFRKAM